MDFQHSERSRELQAELTRFLDEQIYPAEAEFHQQEQANRDAGTPFRTPDVLHRLKAEAQRRGLWNLFLPDVRFGPGLSVLDYAPLAELSGRSIQLAPEAMNCSAPDTGNMELLAMFGTHAQHEQWLKPLLAGEIRSCFSMTEPDVASSDATNIATRISRDGEQLPGHRHQVVVDRSASSRMQAGDRDGRLRAGRRSARPALDDPGAAGYARRHGAAVHHRLRLRRRSARRARRDRLRPGPGARRATCSGRRAVASGWLRPGWGPVGSTTACERSGSPSERWS